MINSLIKVLELPNLCHMTKSIVKFELHDKFSLMTSNAETITSQPLFLNIFILRRSRVAIFANIIKIVTIFVKKIFQD